MSFSCMIDWKSFARLFSPSKPTERPTLLHLAWPAAPCISSAARRRWRRRFKLPCMSRRRHRAPRSLRSQPPWCRRPAPSSTACCWGRRPSRQRCCSPLCCWKRSKTHEPAGSSESWASSPAPSTATAMPIVSIPRLRRPALSREPACMPPRSWPSTGSRQTTAPCSCPEARFRRAAPSASPVVRSLKSRGDGAA